MDYAYGSAPGAGATSGTTSKKDKNKTPQELVGDFWQKFFAKKPGKVTSIFPRSLYTTLLPPLKDPRGSASACNAAESYEAAAKECREKVKRIVRECNRTNERFTDPDFDIEEDPDHNCLNGLVRTEYTPVDIGDDAVSYVSGAAAGPRPTPAAKAVPKSKPRGVGAAKYGVRGDEYYSPGAIHRVDWIFDNPQFIIDGYSSSDIRQGADGDCWWLAAVATIAHRRDLMDKVCVARDEECGVYGFVFHRDGEWISTVIDDNLYLSMNDFIEAYGDAYDPSGKKARKYRMSEQTGSDALLFSKCADQNETWLPLLEKAYAKIHGDYEAISGGWSGEAIEDMCGGVTTTIATKRVLRKDRLWRELASSDGEFVFALSAIGTSFYTQTQSGLYMGHAYSILRATEEVGEDGKKLRLVQIRNPWGQRDGYQGLGEWNGPWSDGSAEWTPYWMKKLNHTFGDDGVFWMSYDDVLEVFMFMHRTRLFDEKWTVVQQWTSVNISWLTGYLQTKFLLEIKKSGKAVIVLTQLDERYFQGFEGQYEFALHFLLQKENGEPGEHICRVRPVHSWENRSVSCEVELDPGRYEVLPKITAVRDVDKQPVEDIVRHWAEKNPQKLRQVGMQYDLAHAKGGVPDEDDLLEKKRAEEKRKRDLKKKKEKEEAKRAEEQAKLDAAPPPPPPPPSGPEVNGDKASGESSETAKETDADKKDDAAKDGEKEEFQDASENQPSTDEKATAEKTSESKEETDPAPGAAAPLPETEKKEEADDKKKDDDKKEEDKKDDKKDGDDKKDEKKDGEGDEEESEQEEAADDDDDTTHPWNAVCVIALRVYAQDPNVTITLVKPKDAEEAASLAVDATPAGATM